MYLKSKNKVLRKEKGITLIALVVTIIVLLILAGVTIAAISGDNGILNNAARAKEETAQAEKDEKEKLGDMEDTINEYVTGIEVEQVTDSKPGELEADETDANTYIINSIEDLVVFASDVRNSNTYEGKTVKLGLSLDFNSNKSYVDPLRTDYGEYGYDGELKTLLTSQSGFLSIGSQEDIKDGSNCFQGIFDGNGKIIYNLYIDKILGENVNICGLFSTNFGTITNLNLENINLKVTSKNNAVLVGGITGRNSGTIINCSTSGDINVTNNGSSSVQVGGIVGQGLTSEKIDKCINKCNLNIDINTGSGRISGVVGSNNGNEVTSCCNYGNILVSNYTEETIIVAGITSNSLITNCYNSGNIFVNSYSYGTIHLAGILGRSMLECSNCYNVGDITLTGEAKVVRIGGIGSELTNVMNSINFGKITANADTLYLGGVFGYSYQGNINNIYNYGEIAGIGTTANYKGLLIGRIHTATLKDGFYKEQGDELAIGNTYNSTTENINVLDNELDTIFILGDEFKKDTNNINNGYPILNWQ